MNDQLNVPLEDTDLLAEVELTTNLIIAASEADDTLSQEQIDQLLGVVPTRDTTLGPDATDHPRERAS